MAQPNYILYIVMRNDMESLNPGKGMAQAAHAAQNFTAEYSWLPEYKEWCEDRHFGTTVVLSCTEQQLQDVMRKAVEFDVAHGHVLDETYPIRDGATMHYLPVVTCGFVFGNKSNLLDVIGHLKLYR